MNGVLEDIFKAITSKKSIMERVHYYISENSHVGELSEECSKYGEID